MILSICYQRRFIYMALVKSYDFEPIIYRLIVIINTMS